MIEARCKDPEAEKHEWEVWPIDPEKYDVDGIAVPIGPKYVYKTDDYYYAEEAYWNEHLKAIADEAALKNPMKKRISFNGFRTSFKHRRLDDKRFSAITSAPDLKGFVDVIKETLARVS